MTEPCTVQRQTSLTQPFIYSCCEPERSPVLGTLLGGKPASHTHTLRAAQVEQPDLKADTLSSSLTATFRQEKPFRGERGSSESDVAKSRHKAASSGKSISSMASTMEDQYFWKVGITQLHIRDDKPQMPLFKKRNYLLYCCGPPGNHQTTSTQQVPYPGTSS